MYTVNFSSLRQADPRIWRVNFFHSCRGRERRSSPVAIPVSGRERHRSYGEAPRLRVGPFCYRRGKTAESKGSHQPPEGSQLYQPLMGPPGSLAVRPFNSTGGSLSASPAVPGSLSSWRGPAALAPHVSVFPSPQELGLVLAQLVVQHEAQCRPGGLLAFADERHVPLSEPKSNYGGYQMYLLSKIAVPEDQIVVINPLPPVEEAAADYAAKLKEAFQGEDMPVFDLLILGVGPDGHTSSLFPDHSLLQEREKIVAAISDSPKPPPECITLTIPVLNAARSVVFVATGDSKAAVIKRILEGNEENPLPAALVQPHTGKLYWFLDEPAAKELTIPFEKHSIL
nr:6-phosphogluconolactonase-like [Zootoca vivipara]